MPVLFGYAGPCSRNVQVLSMDNSVGPVDEVANSSHNSFVLISNKDYMGPCVDFRICINYVVVNAFPVTPFLVYHDDW